MKQKERVEASEFCVDTKGELPHVFPRRRRAVDGGRRGVIVGTWNKRWRGQLEVTSLCVWLPSGLNYIMMEERERALPLELY